MSIRIQDALWRLDQSVAGLEQAAAAVPVKFDSVREEATAQLKTAQAQIQQASRAPLRAGRGTGQPDLFAGGAAAQSAASAEKSQLNVRMIAGRLDQAIEQVEQILKSGSR